MKTIHTADFEVRDPVSLIDMQTLLNLHMDEDDIKDKLKKTRRKISDIQDVMYAQNKYSVLICLQGMDTSGKDSLIREVFKEFNPRGVVVSSFKTPNTNELEHDYLWRHYIALPERGKFGVFNRTYYENVLVTRVHKQYIMNENLPEITSVDDITEEFWEKRMEQIVNFEKHIVDNGTIVLKFFLHLGKEEQRQRLLRRLEEAKHNWKFSPGDLKEREYWEDYQKYYEEAINATSRETAPWFVIPADDKETARLIVAKIILDRLEQYVDIQEPPLDIEIKTHISEYKDALEKEEKPE
ncbi:polyphosphate kinase [Flavobacterium noncentrifugens]|uniref:Polyphosphate:nucleotide phosphotransferase, PPK2 family n=1 Tax=Flavobacterium noncentrifugens TaxID=1128970 RepID=A0A1G8VK48_9FLAO|nr:PPK2 family polyphosphate kinase [Flavobacterium noncentrifugens]GEP50542.1 polyphosphate kinase [Flavobacterium noncentrifugens]SDJ66363.1 polyphosphate:nucleotide phosphotransferase, PPK2 family [Flavobacterium noncentrifugens]